MKTREERILELLIYDPSEAGLFRRKDNGKRAGCLDCGYRKISVKGIVSREHRIAYFYYHGTIDPDKFVDHIDGNRLNNAKENLRQCRPSENSLNQKNDKGCVVQYGKKWRTSVAGMDFGMFYDHRVATDIANAFNELRCGEFKRHINYRDEE